MPFIYKNIIKQHFCILNKYQNKIDIFHFLIIKLYMHLYLLIKVKSLKKFIILILLFETIKITNNNLYSYKINNFHILNKNSNFINGKNDNNDISQINQTINKNNIFFNEFDKDNNYSSKTISKPIEENGSNYIFKNNNYSSDLKLNYPNIKDEPFWRNESLILIK
jgi:hypothetical protein